MLDLGQMKRVWEKIVDRRHDRLRQNPIWTVQRYRVRLALGGKFRGRASSRPFLSPCKGTSVASGKAGVTLPNAPSPHMQCSRTESSVDDLRTSQGVVSGLSASSLRSAETLPLTG